MNNSEILNEKNKMKLLKNKLLRNACRATKNNLSQLIYPKMNFSTYHNSFYSKKTFNSSFSKDENPSINPYSNNNKIITKKLKITPKLSRNIKKEHIGNINEEIIKIYNIKDIVDAKQLKEC